MDNDATAMSVAEEIRRDRESGARRLETEYKAGLMAFARRFCTDEADAEALVYRTFAEVVEGIDSYTEQSAFFGWMCKILVNCHAKSVRRKSNRTVFCAGDVPDQPDEDGAEKVFAAVDSAILRDAVMSLPRDMKEAVILHYFMEMPLRQIAKMLTMPTGTVMSRLYYARIALARRLGERMKKPGAAIAAIAAALALTAATVAGIGSLLAGGGGTVDAELVSAASAPSSSVAGRANAAAGSGVDGASASGRPSGMGLSASGVAARGGGAGNFGSGETEDDEMKTSTAAALGGIALLAAAPSLADGTVVIHPGDGVETNVYAVFTGTTALSVNPGDAGGGIVTLNAANAHSGGTALGCGTLAMDCAGGAGRSPVGSAGLTVGAATLRYSGPGGETLAVPVASSFGEDSLSATVFDARADIALSGGWTQPYGGFVKTGPGTLSIAGGDNSFGSRGADGGSGVFTDNMLSARLSFSDNGDAPTSGFGAFTVAEGTFRIDGGTNLFGWESDASGSQIGAWTVDEGTEKGATLEIAGGSNVFVGKTIVGRQNGNAATGGDGVVSRIRVTGGDTTFRRHLIFGWNDSALAYPGQDSRQAYEQSGGTVAMGSANVQFAYTKGSKTTFTMTGGSFDANGVNGVVGFTSQSGAVSLDMDISGGGSLRNLKNFYIHSNGAGGKLSATVRDGGTLGFASFYNSASGGDVSLLVDGGTIVNDASGKASATDYFAFLQNSVSSFAVGPKGATFRTANGASGGLAQLSKGATAVAAADGEVPAGVTFAGGSWGIYADMDWEGPTRLEDGATLFIGSAGSLPADSAVSVSGGSTLRNLGAEKTVASLSLADGAALAFGISGSAKPLTVSGAVSIAGSVKVALYSNGNPNTGKIVSTDGTYVLLKVPAEAASALTGADWSYPSLASGKKASFSVSVSGSVASLAMTISDGAEAGADISVAGGETVSVGGSLGVGAGTVEVSGGTLSVGANLTGTGGAGVVRVTGGGVLDVAGTVRPSGESGARFDLYVEDGGVLKARAVQVAEARTADAAHSLHFDGATVFPVAAATGDNYSYFPRYASAYLGAGGVAFDLSEWAKDGVSGWYRFNCTAAFDVDPDCEDGDGGIAVRGEKGSTALFMFGSGFASSTMTGGVTVEAGGAVTSASAALDGKSLALLPGASFKAYAASTTALAGDLALGADGADEAVSLAIPASADVPAFAVSGSLAVLSPVEVSLSSGWNYDAGVAAGEWTILVFDGDADGIDASLFVLPEDARGTFSLSVAAKKIEGGTWDGWTALVATVTEGGEATDGDYVCETSGAISGASSYGSIYVGDFGVAADRTLTVADGASVTAAWLDLAYMPADGADGTTGRHADSYVQNGGTVRVGGVRSAYRGTNEQTGRANTSIAVNGGLLDIAGDCALGYNRTRGGYVASLAVNGGRVAVGGDLLLTRYSGGANAQQGLVTVNDGGELDVSGKVDLSSCENASGYAVDGGLRLKGGVLKADNIVQGAAACKVQRLVFDGGTFAPYGKKAASRTMSGLYSAAIGPGGAAVSTELLPSGTAYEIAQPLLADGDGADGGFAKLGAGTLVLSGANTFTGPTSVMGGTLALSGDGAISRDVTVAPGAVLDLGGGSVSVETIAASGTVANGTLSVSGAIDIAGGGTLAVDGDLALETGVAVDFGVTDGDGPSGWITVAAVTGDVSLPRRIRARNAGGSANSCVPMVADGVLYVQPKSVGTVIVFR